jgi:predicted dehydrogenase
VVRVGVIGGGYGRTVHLPGLSRAPGAAVVAVADGGSGRMAGLGPAYFPSWRDLIERAGIDAVSIAAPPVLHAPIALAALARGLHVLCEKPFGRDVAEAEAMAAAVPAGVVGAVNYQFRYEPGVRALRDMLAGGRIGTLRRIDVTWVTSGRADPARAWGFQHDRAAGGGVIEGFLCHCLDYALWLSGERPRRVWGRADILIGARTDSAGVAREVTAEDSADAVIELSGGVVVTARVSNCQPGRDLHRIALAGDAGWAELDQHVPAGPRRLSVGTAAGITEAMLEPPTPGADSRLTAFVGLATDFLDVIGGGDPPDLPRFADGARVRRVLGALRDAVADGGWRGCT